MTHARTAVALFLSLGITAGVGSGSVTAAPAKLSPSTPAVPEGGESPDEGRGHDHPAVSSDLQLLLVLAQMRGHLLAAEELLNRGNGPAAEPHTGHPVDELYGTIDSALQQRRIAPFLSTLEALRQQVRLAPDSPLTRQRLNAARAAIARSEAALPAALRNNPLTTQLLARELAASAASEYAGAEDDGRILEVIEYQDGRGFLRQAELLLTAALGRRDSSAADRAALSRLQLQIKAMLRAFPSIDPPSRAVMSAQQLRRLQPQP